MFAGGAEPDAGTGLLSIVAAVVNIALSIALVRHIGSLGVIGGTILSYIFVLVVPQSLIVRSLFKRELAVERETLFAFRSSLFAKTKFLYSATEARNSACRRLRIAVLANGGSTTRTNSSRCAGEMCATAEATEIPSEKSKSEELSSEAAKSE